MLKKLRLLFEAFCFIGITLLFLDFSGTVHTWFGWMAKIQFLPAVLGLNLVVIVAVIAATLLFGRVYCSIICPLGIMQDIFGGLADKFKKNRYSYLPAISWLRYAMVGILVIAVLTGIGSVAAILAPYSTYGRIVTTFFAPLWSCANNVLASLAERADSYAFYKTEIWIKSLPVFVISGVFFVLIAILAWRNGRTWCNTICPVGTVLGFLSKFALLKPSIDISKCSKCGLCAHRCKASCINSKEQKIDYSRCIACMNCISNCPKKAIGYQRKKNTVTAQTAPKTPQANSVRRSLIAGISVLAASAFVKAQEKTVDGGLTLLKDKKIPNRKTPIVPPGAQSLRNMARHCTGCQLCVSVCPNGVLRPSTSLKTIMQPESSYERGYCRPECTKCSEVCPAGAIQKISKADKSAVQIGHAVWIKDYCVSLTDKVSCGNCARHCPTGAIIMVPSNSTDPNSPQIPAVNIERCIGCGACENLCPARPHSAIYVEGHEYHRTI